MIVNGNGSLVARLVLGAAAFSAKPTTGRLSAAKKGEKRRGFIERPEEREDFNLSARH